MCYRGELCSRGCRSRRRGDDGAALMVTRLTGDGGRWRRGSAVLGGVDHPVVAGVRVAPLAK